MIGDLYTPEEVATELKVERRSVYRWLLSGRLRGLRAGDTWRIAEQDLIAFLESRGPGSVPQPGAEAVVEIGPLHPDYAKWEAYFGKRAHAAKKQGKSLKDAGRTAPKAKKEGRKAR